MKNIKLTIEYEGTNYGGWQSQDSIVTIQETIENALKTLTKEEIKLNGSGRTDAKVHALGQVANFKTMSNIPGERYKYALRHLLPEDIVIVESEEVNMDFHARFSAKKKRYRYRVYNGERPKALYRNFSYHVPYPIDMDKMIRASKDLIGTHDFICFMASKSVVKSTIRTIYSIDISKENDIIEFVIEGNSFLRNMIRIIVGTLLTIGLGRLDENAIPDIINGKDREKAGRTAPAQGLFLEKVYY